MTAVNRDRLVLAVSMMTPDDVQKSIEPIKDDAKLLAEELHTLDEMVAMLEGHDEADADYLKVLDHLRHFFLTDLMQHMQHEEQVFFPAVQQLPQGTGSSCGCARNTLNCGTRSRRSGRP